MRNTAGPHGTILHACPPDDAVGSAHLDRQLFHRTLPRYMPAAALIKAAQREHHMGVHTEHLGPGGAAGAGTTSIEQQRAGREEPR